jgi:hypothetical protein
MSTLSTYAKNFTHGSVKILDGTSVTPLEVSLDCDMGDISLSGLVDGLYEIIKYERRGRLKSVARGTRVYPSGSLTAMWAQFTDVDAGTVEDMLSGHAGTAYAARIGTLGAGRPVTFDIVVTIEGTDFGDDFDHTFTMTDCRIVHDWAEGDPDTISLSWEVLGAITGDLTYSEAA